MAQAQARAGWRVAFARVAYLVAVAAVGLQAWYRADDVPMPTWTFATLGLLGLAFLALVWRPHAWGRLLALAVGAAWALPGLLNQLAFGPTLSLNLVTGAMLLAAAVAHQLAAPAVQAQQTR